MKFPHYRSASTAKTVVFSAFFAALSAFGAAAEEPFFDELRFGAQVASDKSTTNDERGSFYQLTMFFDPFENKDAVGWKEKLTRPRLYMGGTVASDGDEASMIFGGLSWNANITQKLFAEVGFGGMVHNGDLDEDGTRGPKLGCRTLFREYAALGYDVTEHWRVLAQIEHSSHANLCGDTNNGLTRAGLAVGYKF